MVVIGVRTQDKRLQSLEEAFQQKKPTRPIIIEGLDPAQKLIDDEFNAVKEV